jgi:hypothetical protein
MVASAFNLQQTRCRGQACLRDHAGYALLATYPLRFARRDAEEKKQQSGGRWSVTVEAISWALNPEHSAPPVKQAK